MNPQWQLLNQELTVWHEQGRVVPMWWRDDDACGPSAALRRLLTLSVSSDVPLALAMVPTDAQSDALAGMPAHLGVLQHGVDHLNRGSPQQKKTEFPESEPVPVMLERLVTGQRVLQGLFGRLALPVLVPPWNRFPRARISDLAQAGYRGLSTYSARLSAQPAPGLRQVNTHVDIIDWHRDRVFVGEHEAVQLACKALRARRAGEADANEPLGWLTHHAVHDDVAWAFLARLFDHTRGHPAVRWLSGQEVFAAPGPTVP